MVSLMSPGIGKMDRGQPWFQSAVAQRAFEVKYKEGIFFQQQAAVFFAAEGPMKGQYYKAGMQKASAGGEPGPPQAQRDLRLCRGWRMASK